VPADLQENPMFALTNRLAPRRGGLALSLALALLKVTPLGAAEQSWTFLPIEDIGARTFLAQNPTYDGRGVIVAVLDTGVDMTVPGLITLPDGSTKVIDARDFTGQGTIELGATEPKDGVLEVADGLHLEGLGALKVQPVADHLVWTGVLQESKFLNSSLQDLDDDGSDGDRFGIVVFAAERAWVREVLGEGKGVALRRTWGPKAVQAEDAIARERYEWIVVVDVDRDGHLDDETLLRDYATDLQSFNLKRRATEGARDVLGISVDVSGESKPSLNLHHDDGGHGTHVAGIAAGYGVHGQQGLNGVAPGAWVISCKLGNNSLSGGATVTESMKKSYEYVGALSERYGVPIVINMSYGIGSEIEGDAAMDRWLDEWLDEHSEVVVCHSASNAGPGLSNVGLPAAADGVIASAAMISKEMARDLYGGAFAKDELFDFSSRGGELAKPDVSAPGGASSTIPLWDTRDRYNGTSMASPQTAGAVACILSGLHQTDRAWNFGTIKRALVASARPMPGYTRIDVGGGVVDLSAAFAAAKAYADAGEADLVTIYTVRTEAPAQPDGEAPAAYWRAGGYFPAAPEQQEFRITPRFAKQATDDTRNKFYRAFRLNSDVDWIRVDRSDTYVKGPDERAINLSYDATKLKQPGVYVGTVRGSAKDAGRSGAAAHEFELVVTIVVPETFDASSKLEWNGRRLDPGAFERFFFRVPAYATSFTTTLEIPRGKAGEVRFVLHDPTGRRITRSGFASSVNTAEQTYTVSGEDLVPGIWEVDVRGDFAFAARATYDLAVELDALMPAATVIDHMSFASPGKAPQLELQVTPIGPSVFRGRAAGEIDHWFRERTVKVTESSRHEISFQVDAEMSAVEFDVELTAGAYNLVTDFAINIADPSGHFVVQAGLDQRDTTLRLAKPSPGKYTLQIEAAFVHAEAAESWHFALRERFYLAGPVALKGTARDASTLRLVPDVPVTLQFEAAGKPPIAPDGFVNAGEVRVVEQKSGRTALRVPVRLSD
jgi:tripeptidyl-peptidase II